MLQLKMGRDFKFRILLQGKPVPEWVEDKLREPCNCWTGCDECRAKQEEKSKYATSWEDYDRIGRHNDVLGYCYHRICNEEKIKQIIQEITEEMSLRAKNGEYDFRDHVEALSAFEYILRQIRDHDGWMVEIRYD